MSDRHDNLEIYCPQMGTLITFNYCRRVQSGLPCRNVVNCWETRIPIGSFLKDNFSEEELLAAFGGLPKTRLERIFACVEAARKDLE